MNSEIELHGKWLSGEQLVDVKFKMNDYVLVTSGKYAGASGSVVSVVQFMPDTPYIVETESGGDIEVRESEITIYCP